MHPNKIPKLDKIKENFLIYKGIKNQKKLMVQSKISWDIIYDETVDVEEKYFKCKVDNNNKINVFIQNSFDLEYNSASVQIFKCAKLFHSNDYPILIIETKNGGGDPKLSLLIIQLFQKERS